MISTVTKRSPRTEGGSGAKRAFGSCNNCNQAHTVPGLTRDLMPPEVPDQVRGGDIMP